MLILGKRKQGDKRKGVLLLSAGQSALAVLAVAALCISAAGCMRRPLSHPATAQVSQQTSSVSAADSAAAASSAAAKKLAAQSASCEAAYRASFQALVEKIYGKPYADVTQSDYARLKGMCVGEYDRFYYALNQVGVSKNKSDFFVGMLSTYDAQENKTQDSPPAETMGWKSVDYDEVSGLQDFLENDIQMLRCFTALEYFQYTGYYIGKTDFLSAFPKLWYLDLDGTGIEDLSILSSLRELRYCAAAGNSVEKIGTLGKALVVLNLERNRITDLSPLSSATGLQYLNLSLNQIEKVDVLSKLSTLKQLYLTHNKIADLGPLGDSSAPIESILFSYNAIRDLTPIGKFVQKDRSLTWLSLDHNAVSEISALQYAKTLTNLDLSYNKVEDISALSDLNLNVVDLSDNPLKSIDALHITKHMTKSRYLSVRLDGTPFADYSYEISD